MRNLVLLTALLPALAIAQVTTSDRDLEKVAEVALNTDATTSAFRLQVKVHEGQARVTGEVDTLKHRWDALDTVGRVRGIVSVEDGLTMGPGGTDGAIQSNVERRLRDIPSLQRQGLEVRVAQGVATLTGRVTDGASRLRAREAAAKAVGIRGVVLHLEVPSRPDADIEAMLVRVLGPRSLTGIPGDVRPEVAEGAVTLSGTVPTVFARDQAERLAWGVDGVRVVRNALRVVP